MMKAAIAICILVLLGLALVAHGGDFGDNVEVGKCASLIAIVAARDTHMGARAIYSVLEALVEIQDRRIRDRVIDACIDSLKVVLPQKSGLTRYSH